MKNSVGMSILDVHPPLLCTLRPQHIEPSQGREIWIEISCAIEDLCMERAAPWKLM